MKKLFCVFVLCVLMFIQIKTSYAGGWGNVRQAEDFIAGRMFNQAIAVLDNEIKNSPKNAKAHYLLAICYLSTGNFFGADQRFESAISLKPNYGYQAGSEYRTAGIFALNNGRINDAERLFTKASEYQPNLKAGLAEEFFKAGMRYMPTRLNDASYCFNTAMKINGNLREKICDTYFITGKQTGYPNDILIFETAVSTICGGNIQIVSELFKLKDQSLRYGEQCIVLNKNEKTKWIKIPGNAYYEIHTKGDADYTVDFNDGTTLFIKDGSNTPFPIKTEPSFIITSHGLNKYIFKIRKNN